MSAKINLDEFVEKSKQIHQDKYDYSRIVEFVFGKKVTISCREHDMEFLQLSNTHFRGHTGCPKCKTENKIKTYLDKYGVENPFQSKEVQSKIKITNIRKYGVGNPSQSEEVKEKKRKTSYEKFGVENPVQSPEIRAKMRASCFAHYGVEYSMQSEEVKTKHKKTMMKNHGVEHNWSSEKVKANIRATHLRIRGVEYPKQSAAVQDKTWSKSSKKFTFPSGNSYTVQGYEPKAIQRLLSEGYKEEDLLLKNRPAIKYFWSANDGNGDDKWHFYHPDIVIPKENRIIEVKSTYTYNGNSKILSMNLAKEKACLAQGYNFEFMVI